MDGRLFEAAILGNIDQLYQLLQENPLLLSEISLLSPNENPLHVATKAGQLVFVREIVKIKPEFAHELNKHGFRPLDIASACGYVEIVKAILVSGSDVQRLKGRDGRTALHYAALKGRVEVIDELVSSCLECVKDVTTVDETALHLAAKYYQIEALRRLIEWVDAEEHGLEEVLNWSDRDGNTILHLSVSGAQLETIELLLGSRMHTTSKLLQLNAINYKGLTPMDIADILIETPNNTNILPKLAEILRCAGALRAKDIASVSFVPPLTAAAAPEPAAAAAPAPAPAPEDHLSNLMYFKFNPNRDSPGQMRDAILVVAALIVSATFQGAMSPPSFLNERETTFFNRSMFLFFNTLGFFSAISIIAYLTVGFPFRRELGAALISLGCAYYTLVMALIRSNDKPIRIPILAIALSLPMALRELPRLKKFYILQLIMRFGLTLLIISLLSKKLSVLF